MLILIIKLILLSIQLIQQLIALLKISLLDDNLNFYIFIL